MYIGYWKYYYDVWCCGDVIVDNVVMLYMLMCDDVCVFYVCVCGWCCDFECVWRKVFDVWCVMMCGECCCGECGDEEIDDGGVLVWVCEDDGVVF